MKISEILISRKEIEHIQTFNVSKVNNMLTLLKLPTLSLNVTNIFNKNYEDVTKQDKENIESFKNSVNNTINSLSLIDDYLIYYYVPYLGDLVELSESITKLDWHS